MEPHASLEADAVISDAETVVGGSIVIGEVDDMGDTEVTPQRGFMFGGILWDAVWIDCWDQFDGDLDDW